MSNWVPKKTDASPIVSNNSISDVDPALSPPASPGGLGRKLSMALLKGQPEQPTVVHRTKFKSRPSVMSMDREILEITPENSPSTSTRESSSGKSSVPRPGESTGKTSLDSKFSTKSKGQSHNSSENKKTVSKQTPGEGGSFESPLTPIAEVEHSEALEPPAPSKLLLEHVMLMPSNFVQPLLQSRRLLRPKSSSNAITMA